MIDLRSGEFAKYYSRYGDPTEQLHHAYDSWLADMSSRDNAELEPIPYDLEAHPEQGIYVPKSNYLRTDDVLGPGDYSGTKLKMALTLGELTSSRLVQQIREQPVSVDDPTKIIDRLAENQKQGKNTMIVSSHFTFPEFGFIRALRDIAEDNQGTKIDENAVLLNKLMTRQTYHHITVAEHFTPVGNVYWSYPKSASADKHGVPLEARNLGNALFQKAIRPDLDKGGLILDAALTGSEIKSEKDEAGSTLYYSIPDVDPASAKLIERFDGIVPATMIKSPVTGEWVLDIGDYVDVSDLIKTNSSADITDMVYHGIARSVEQITRRDVVYKDLGPRMAQAKSLRSEE